MCSLTSKPGSNLVTIKICREWKSSTVVEGYIENSLEKETQIIANQIFRYTPRNGEKNDSDRNLKGNEIFDCSNSY